MNGVAEVLFAGYRAGGVLLRPFVPLALAWRTANGKEDAARRAERYGRSALPRPPGSLVWVHAVSVGETNAVLPLIRRLTGEGRPVLFTSTTRTSAAIAAQRLPDGALHQYAPVDIAAYADRFLDHWRPDLAVFAELEMWPARIDALRRRSIPLVLVNAHLSERSFHGWRRLGAGADGLFAAISLCLAQSEEDARRFAALGAPNVAVSGNLKFDTPPLQADAGELAKLEASIAGRPVWVAASTHEGEEKIVAEAHRLLRTRHPGVLTILAPRHPERGTAIREAIGGSDLIVAQRSRSEPVAAATDVYLADTLNELGLFYRLAPVAFIGGSLTGNGGHNPIEATRLGATVLHGPDVHNFADLYARIDRACPGRPIADAASLADAVADLISDRQQVAARSAATLAALAPLSGALERTVAALAPFAASAGASS